MADAITSLTIAVCCISPLVRAHCCVYAAAACCRLWQGMSILQLASPHSTRQATLIAAQQASAAMPPPASPLVLGMHAPPPSPAHPPVPPHLQHMAAHAAAQAQRLLTLVAEDGRDGCEGRSAQGADDADAAEGAHADDHPDDEQRMSDDEEEEEEFEDEDDDGRSVSSQSCPPSPLASALLSAADSNATNATTGRRSTSRVSQLPLRRRSVGSSAQYENERRSSGVSTERGQQRRQAKVAAAAGSPAFKKRNGEVSVGGSSCHQCKSRRAWNDLTYCTSSLNKKNKNAICRKKFCEHCLKKFYRENAYPPGTSGHSGATWKCPSCRKICCCAACRRREQRDDGGEGPQGHSNDNTPLPTPLYRGAGDPSRGDHDSLMQSSPLQSSSPSPTALSMQRLLLSPTGHPVGAGHITMSPLPPTSSLAHKMHASSMLTPKQQSMHAYNTKSAQYVASPSQSSLSSHSPPPIEGPNAAASSSTAATVASHLASLTALSQAAMRDSPNHSITISLQNHVSSGATAAAASAAASSAAALQSHHTGGSVSSVSSPNDMRGSSSGGVGTASSIATGGLHGTPKATSTSLYSNLLLHGMNPMLTPRSMPRAALPHHLTGAGSAPPLSLAAAAMGAKLTPGQVAAAAVGGGAGGDASLSSGDNTDDHSASSRDEHAMRESAPSASAAPQPSPLAVLPSFALFFALGELPAVRRDVTSILSGEGSNSDKLRRIEETFMTAADKVTNDQLPLQL